MKLLDKLRLLVGSVVILTSTTIVYIVISQIKSYQEANRIAYRDEISDYIRNAISVRNATHYFNINQDSTIISPDISPTLLKSKILMIVIVMTKAQNINQRKLIRDTWKKYEYETDSIVYFYMNKPSSSHYFEALLEESNKYKDIIVDSLIDDHSPAHSLAFSSISSLRMLNWYQIHLSTPSQFLVKTNDINFINLKNLQKYFLSLVYSDILYGFISGTVNEKFSTRKIEYEDPNSPRFTPKDLWDSGEVYPEFIDSKLIVFSQRLVPYILEASGNIPFFHVDDVFITGMIAKWTMKLDLLELPFIDRKCSEGFSYSFWWNGEINLDDVIALECPEKWHMMYVFSKDRDRLIDLEKGFGL